MLALLPSEMKRLRQLEEENGNPPPRELILGARSGMASSSGCGLFDAEQRLSRALVKVLCRSTGTKAAQMT